MHLETRVLVTGGAGFLGSHLCERLLAGRRQRHLRRQFLYRSATQHRAPPRPQTFRAHPTRRHVPALCRGRRDLQSRLPGLAHPLPARPGADHQDERAWRDQHARPRQAGEGEDPASLHLRGLWRPERPPTDRGLLGQRQSDRPAFLLRRRQAVRRNAVLRLLAPAPAAHQGRADFQYLWSAHAPERRARGVEFHRAGLARTRHHGLWRRRADPRHSVMSTT